MKHPFLLCVAALFISSLAGITKEPVPYIGEWSNGRGETLVITAKTIQFIDNKAVPYVDVTEEGEDSYTLELKPSGEMNYLSKFMVFKLKGEEEMASEGYDSMEENAEYVSTATWYRDK